jgi:predicted peptidase
LISGPTTGLNLFTFGLPKTRHDMKQMLAVYILLFSIAANAQDFSAYKYASFARGDGQLPYRILYPLNFDTTRAYPLVIFLHGAGHKGDDNEIQLNIGGAFFLRNENRTRFPAIIIFPQCPAADSWAYFENTLDSATGLAKNWYFPFRNRPQPPIALLKGLLDSLRTLRTIDTNRVYIGGLSQGGMGVLDMIARYPAYFAAGFPMCGAGKEKTAANFAGQVALWFFHGGKDDIVPPSFSRDYYKRLQKLHADVKYTEYPGVFHNCWGNAFGEKDLLPWLFSKSRKK